MILRVIGGLALVLLAGAFLWIAFRGPATAPPAGVQAPAVRARPSPPTAAAPPLVPCDAPARYAQAAAANANSVGDAAWSAFGRPETGWEIYLPLVRQEIGTRCGADAPAFAAALAAWQEANGIEGSGVMDEATLKALNVTWLRRRPFVTATSAGDCPAPADAATLAAAEIAEGYSGKPIQLTAAALAAYRRLAAAARAEAPQLASDPQLLTIFSGFRDPADDTERCAEPGACGTVARANCSAHRTGTALDLYIGAAPGHRPEDSADPNRLYQSRTPVYRWLVANAARFGFVPYPFEPWHWEYAG